MYAKIDWVPEILGGRQQPPVGPTFSTVAFFENMKKYGENWSVVIDFMSGNITPPIYKIRFLSENAPQELLKPGIVFWLTEGRKAVAWGIMLGNREEFLIL